MDFHGIDLNLLVAFDALMNERNVTRAAAQVGVSQPAMSAALARLRTLLADPLFLRSADGLLPTPRARDLAAPIAQALVQLEAALVTKPVFDPGSARLTLNVGMSDYPGFVLLPTLMAGLKEEAPGIVLNVRAVHGRDGAVDLLDAGAIDAAVGVVPTNLDGRIQTRPLLRDTFVTIVAASHPAAQAPMTLDAFLALEHVLVSPEGDRYGVVDAALAQLGKHRTLSLTLPHMFAVPAVVARTRLTATLLGRAALTAADSSGLHLFAPPLALPEIVFHLLWHRRSDTNPAQDWLRGFIARHAAAL
jgi:DNA-binding transcriptional LysR family regulator